MFFSSGNRLKFLFFVFFMDSSALKSNITQKISTELENHFFSYKIVLRSPSAWKAWMYNCTWVRMRFWYVGMVVNVEEDYPLFYRTVVQIRWVTKLLKLNMLMYSLHYHQYQALPSVSSPTMAMIGMNMWQIYDVQAERCWALNCVPLAPHVDDPFDSFRHSALLSQLCV